MIGDIPATQGKVGGTRWEDGGCTMLRKTKFRFVQCTIAATVNVHFYRGQGQR